MQALINLAFASISGSTGTDYVDRLNHLYTPTMFMLVAITISSKQYVGTPIQCWVPPHFTGNWEVYTENLCFTQNTYFVGMDEKFPIFGTGREDKEIGYYQWVPAMMLLHMLATLLPGLILRLFNWNGVKYIRALIENAPVFMKEKKTGKYASNSSSKDFMDNYSKYLTSKSSGSRFSCMDTHLYILNKCLNLLVCLVQVYFLNRILWPEYEWYGYSFVQDLMNNREWKQSGKFPRVTFCDIDIRGIEKQPVKYTIQCVLMINMFNEKIYVVIWFWLLLISMLNALNLVYWVSISYLPCFCFDYVNGHLSSYYVSYPKLKPSAHKVKKFIENHLRLDGITSMRLLETNEGSIVANYVVAALWAKYVRNEKKKRAKKVKNGPKSQLESSEDQSNMPAAQQMN